MTFRPSHENNTIFPKIKKARRARKNKLCGLFSLSGAGFRLSPKELLGCHAPMNSNIVTVVFPDLNPVNQLGDHQMLGFVAGIVKAAGPAQDDNPWQKSHVGNQILKLTRLTPTTAGRLKTERSTIVFRWKPRMTSRWTKGFLMFISLLAISH